MATKTDLARLRIDPAELGRLERAAKAQGIGFSEFMRRAGAAVADEHGIRAKGQPKIEWRWCAKDFEAFCGTLTLPDGKKFRLEGHLRLIVREVFAKGRVELLVLLPKGNYKTTLFAALAVFHALTVANANCYIGAADKIQADEMYRFATHFSETQAVAKNRLLVRRSTREIRSLIDQGFIRVLASDDSRQGGKRQGFNPTLALIDELHAHENSNLYVDMRSGLFKRGGMLVTITTAGQDEESVLGDLRREFLRIDEQGGDIRRGLRVQKGGQVRAQKNGRLTICKAKSGRSVMLEWACRPDDDLDNVRIVKLANPATGVTLASLEDAKEAPGITESQFNRYRANVWSQDDDAEISEAAWDALDDGSTIPDDVGRWVIVDYARKSDATAVTQLWFDEDREVLVPKTHVWAVRVKGNRPQPAAHELLDGPTIRQSLIREHIRQIPEVLGVIFDPHLFDPELLEDEGYLMIEFPQSPVRTVPASKEVYDAIYEGRFAHDGDPVLRSHVTSAGSKPAGEGWRFSKAASKKRMDAMMTLVMGIGQATSPPRQRPMIEVLA